MKSISKPAKATTPADFRKGADVFKALGNPNRLLMVNALGSGMLNAGRLTGTPIARRTSTPSNSIRH